MSKLKALDENLNLTDKRIILRVDLNVPMQEGKVIDKSRVKKIILCNRNYHKAHIVSRELSTSKVKIEPILYNRDSLANYAPYTDIIINTTSLGMAGGPAPMTSPITSELISSKTFGYDIVYSPLITPFIKEFEKSGAEYGTGLSMLLYQGVEGLEKALNIKAPINVMQKALDAL